MAYLETEADSQPLVERLVLGVPGLLPGKEAALAEAVVQNRAGGGVNWLWDETFGWINDGPYSQRNPTSPLSILKDADFAYIGQFFR